MLECHKTTEDEKRIICEWKYDGEYAMCRFGQIAL